MRHMTHVIDKTPDRETHDSSEPMGQGETKTLRDKALHITDDEARTGS